MQRTVAARIPTTEGEFWLFHYRNQRDDKEHLAIVLGELLGMDDVLVRVHSECFTGDVLGSRRCDCGEQLHLAMQQIAAAGRGAILYLRQEGRGIGLEEKLKAYNLQDEGYDTVEANLLLGHQADEREYWAAAGILADLGVHSLRLLTNNPDKLEKLASEGIQVNGSVPLVPLVHADNHFYLETKVQKMRHMLSLPLFPLNNNGGSEPGRNGHHLSGSNGYHSNGNGHPQVTGNPESLASESASQSNSGAMATSQLATRNSHVAISHQLDALQARIAAHTGNLPFVTLAWAQSLDGSIAAQPGKPLRLSSAGSMHVTHQLRAMHDAILVGVGTVLADNPRLTVRGVDGPSPRPVIIDSRLRTPLTSALFDHPKSPIFAAVDPYNESHNGVTNHGGTVLLLPDDGTGRVPLDRLLPRLAGLGIRSIMVEGGAQILASFLDLRLADATVITIAPRFVAGVHIVARGGLPILERAAYTEVDGDMIVWGVVERMRPTEPSTESIERHP